MRDRRPTIVELEALRATVTEGTTAAAGRRLGRSQSSVSRALAELERRLGRPLFERRGRMIVPSAHALALNRRLDPVFAALDGLQGAMPASEPAELAIAAPPAFALSLLPRAFAAFSRDHPGCRLRLEVVATPELVTRVAEGEVEIGLTDSLVASDSVRVEPFRTSQACCLMPAGHRLAARERIPVRELDGERFVALARRHSMRRQIDALLAAAGIRYSVAAETSTAIAALGLIRAGIGIGLLNPFPLIEPGGVPGLVARPLAEPLVYRSAFVLPAHVPPSPIAKRFQGFLARFVRDAPDPGGAG
jgi:DNA-binding transcriptional LysR family regulator